jgi:Asp-tRNA(Asn)/Glu-tRNA(Gln) amidotransferase A subunit family amidase
MPRTVTDAAKMLTVLAGYDPADPDTAWNIGHVDQDYARYLDSDALKGARIGVLEHLAGSEPIHQEVNDIVRSDIERMKAAGAVIVSIDDPMFDANRLVSEVSVHLYDLKPDLNSHLSDPKMNTPVKSLEEIIVSGKYSPSIEPEIKKAQSLDQSDPDYNARLVKRMQLRKRVMQIMAENQLDALAYPHQQRLVVPVGERQVDRNGVVASVTGFPAITVPGGYSKPTITAAIGVPVGIEFLGRPWSEPVLIRIAHAFEQATNFRRPPPSTPSLE